MTGPRYFSMFSGIGGFELGIQQAVQGARCLGFSEIDPCATAVYERHFKEHQNYGDARHLDADQLDPFYLLLAGFPCQAFSAAGLRRGFADQRGDVVF